MVESSLSLLTHGFAKLSTHLELEMVVDYNNVVRSLWIWLSSRGQSRLMLVICLAVM
jgi:hypothetical protein